MAGLINQRVAEEQGAPSPEAPPQDQGAMNADGGQPKYKTRVIEAIPPEKRAAFEKIVLGGMRVLYSEEMRDEIEAEGARQVPIFKKLGEGIAKLMTLLDRQSGKSFPVELVIPAGIELVAEFADFLTQSGRSQISPDELRKATIYFTLCAGKLYGASDEQLQGLFKQQAGQEPAATERPETPAPEQMPT